MTSLEELQASSIVPCRSALLLMQRNTTSPHPGILAHALQSCNEALALYMAHLEDERTPQDIEDARGDAQLEEWRDS